MWSPCERSGHVLCWCLGASCQYVSPVPLERVRDTYSVVCTVPFRESQSLIRLSLLPDTTLNRWVPFDAFDVPTVAGKDPFLSTLREGPESSLAVVNCASLNEKLTCIASRCVGHTVRLFTLGWK